MLGGRRRRSQDDSQGDSFAAACAGGPLLCRSHHKAGSRQRFCSDARTMATHAEASDLSAAPTELRDALDALGLARRRVAELFGVSPRSVGRWQDGDRRVPCGVSIVLHLLAARVVTVTQVERAAAAAIPVQTNGGAKPEPPAPLLVAPAPEPALAPAKAATPADPDLSTAEKVVALAPDACRWPCGDPGRADFHFCGGPTTRRPYCEHHHARACWRRSAASMAPSLMGVPHADLPLRSRPPRCQAVPTAERAGSSRRVLCRWRT
jgi:hypothetical protein